MMWKDVKRTRCQNPCWHLLIGSFAAQSRGRLRGAIASFLSAWCLNGGWIYGDPAASKRRETSGKCSLSINQEIRMYTPSGIPIGDQFRMFLYHFVYFTKWNTKYNILYETIQNVISKYETIRIEASNTKNTQLSIRKDNTKRYAFENISYHISYSAP